MFALRAKRNRWKKRKDNSRGTNGCCTGHQSSKKHDATSSMTLSHPALSLEKETINFSQNANPTCKRRNHIDEVQWPLHAGRKHEGKKTTRGFDKGG